MNSLLQGGEGKSSHKFPQLESESGSEPKFKPILCHDLLLALASFFKGQDDKGHGAHCRRVMVETAFPMSVPGTNTRCSVINASGSCDEFHWECNAKETFSFLGSYVFSEDDNHLIHSFPFLACYQEAPNFILKLSNYLSQVIRIYTLPIFYMLCWNVLFYCIHIFVLRYLKAFWYIKRRIYKNNTKRALYLIWLFFWPLL